LLEDAMETMVGTPFLLAMAVAAVCGGAAGRVFALEGENRRTSVLTAAYCGAGAGLVSGPLAAFAAVLVATMLDPEAGLAAGLASAGGAVGPALLWGAASGAGGGLLVGILVAAFKRYTPRPS
jgi:hypothetical protein